MNLQPYANFVVGFAEFNYYKHKKNKTENNVAI